MSDPSEVVLLREAIKTAWGSIKPNKKAAGYIGAFVNSERRGSKLIAQVEGNHGIYTVSIVLEKGGGLRGHAVAISAGMVTVITYWPWRARSCLMKLRSL